MNRWYNIYIYISFFSISLSIYRSIDQYTYIYTYTYWCWTQGMDGNGGCWDDHSWLLWIIPSFPIWSTGKYWWWYEPFPVMGDLGGWYLCTYFYQTLKKWKHPPVITIRFAPTWFSTRPSHGSWIIILFGGINRSRFRGEKISHFSHMFMRIWDDIFGDMISGYSGTI